MFEAVRISPQQTVSRTSSDLLRRLKQRAPCSKPTSTEEPKNDTATTQAKDMIATPASINAKTKNVITTGGGDPPGSDHTAAAETKNNTGVLATLAALWGLSAVLTLWSYNTIRDKILYVPMSVLKPLAAGAWALLSAVGAAVLLDPTGSSSNVRNTYSPIGDH